MGTGVEEQDLCFLLQTLLECALLGKPYPGQGTPSPPFPDIEMVKDVEEIVVSDRNLDAPCQLDIPGIRIVVLTEEEITARTDSIGDFPYFSLAEAAVSASEATLSLQLSWAVSETSRQAGKLYMSGGGVRVRFQRVEGAWRAPTGPIATWMA